MGVEGLNKYDEQGAVLMHKFLFWRPDRQKIGYNQHAGC